jgi:hypothetical protein
MLTMRRDSFARCAAAAVVIGGHVLLIVLLSRSHPRPFSDPTSSHGTLVVLELRPLPELPPAPVPERGRPVATASRVQPGPPPAPVAAARAAPVPPRVDWYREAKIVAREIAGQAMPLPRNDCDEVPRPGSLRPRCRKSSSDFLWHPEPRRVGIQGGIPYVRVGPCVVALIAFGCGIGKTEANGDLFKDMRHPDRPTSSVPDVDEVDR